MIQQYLINNCKIKQITKLYTSMIIINDDISENKETKVIKKIKLKNICYE